ncbi:MULTISPECIES: DUF4335 domain-containing protein [unclassified Leptolyngbya]|uniref:DUF4335 domain-containing protein n=1 Tax=unclassified Leptolyngbya TaxID=2650499 RepID=UPI001682FF9E|nr:MULTISPECIES: DUF4335 domain-containing protein [unclassified Leptolyngbya]MBD1911190.1 DUF4335 domain-containing protein [Leptolyngbya sp. FACHB-8]MBD2155437.1 DUF4335 domain-containing protein [Leptolyngbya sp. FACHB-16]
MPTSVLRRYTPPTCTLEVRANQSSLSRWADQTVLRDVRFNLHLDDPQRPDARVVQISGDRNQLEALGDVVSRYVQNLLDSDVDTTDSALLRLTPQSPRLLERNLEVLPLGAERSTATNGSPIALHTPVAAAESGIFIEPRGLLAHDLHLGTLSTPESGDVVRLSAVQLFDLANALDDYSAEMLALPSQQRAVSSTRRWASMAAMLVLAIGATGGITKFVMDVSAPAPTQVAQESAPENVAVQSVPTTPPPAAGAPLPVPGATPQPNGLSQTTKVPPGAPPGSVQPGFPFPVPPPQGNTAPRGQGAPVPPGAVAVQPAPTRVPQSPQIIPGGGASTTQGANVPSNPTVRQAPPETFSTSEAPSISAARQADPEAAAGDTAAIAPPPTARNRPTTDLSRAGVEIPQTNEVQSYFQERWQPPENLGETLEYRLTLGADGSVEQITPLGDAAGVYIDRTNMPLLGDNFVSPLAPYQRAMVRVILAPDGRVQTFLEEVN